MVEMSNRQPRSNSFPVFGKRNDCCSQSLPFSPDGISTSVEQHHKFVDPETCVEDMGVYKQGRYQGTSREEIGVGSFGIVYEAKDLKCNRKVAIKRLFSREDIDVEENTRVEIEFLETIMCEARKQRRDSHVVSLLDHFLWEGTYFLVFEKLSVSLYDLLLKSSLKGLPLNLIRRISAQIIQGIDFLEDMGIVHCDLKPENVMISVPRGSGGMNDYKEWKVKIIDLGSAQCIKELPNISYVQSRWYRAPEVHLCIPLDSKIDLWSLGCIMVELFAGNPLFLSIEQSEDSEITWSNTESALFDICRRLGPIPTGMMQHAIQTQSRNGCSPELNLLDLDFRIELMKFGHRHGPECGLSSFLGIEEASSRTSSLGSMGARTSSKKKNQGLNLVSILQELDDELKDGILHNRIKGKLKGLKGTQHEEMMFLDMVQSLVRIDPMERMNAKEATCHPFIGSSKKEDQLTDMKLPASARFG